MLIVRRGLSRRYYDFLNVAVIANGDELVVDRRVGEAPPGSDAGRVTLDRPDRRALLPQSWIGDDVIVVER
jgi:hypothetical protein